MALLNGCVFMMIQHNSEILKLKAEVYDLIINVEELKGEIGDLQMQIQKKTAEIRKLEQEVKHD